MHDVVIVGGGPAGITAAIYSTRKRLKTIVLTRDVGGQAAWSSDIENYTGYQFITGAELSDKFREQVKSLDIQLSENDEVHCIKKDGATFKIEAKSGAYKAKTVVFATGRKPKELGVNGEVEFKNRGVTYCATCDGPLFAGKDVAVVGGGNSAMDSALQLMNIAKKVYILNINDDLAGDEIMKEKLQSAKNVEIINGAQTKEIAGGKFVEKIKVSVDGVEKSLDVQGVFIEVGSLPVKAPVECKHLGVELNQYGEIRVNARCETNVPGFFAAGDVTDVAEKQIIVAAGQGCIAALSAFKYISKNKF
ncbi:MAG TPA: FAD-binding protein [Candidatus Altiarchaeales archaeon]|nr:FAD-binding protein [Candidatus Altiarchaeales archaeon]